MPLSFVRYLFFVYNCEYINDASDSYLVVTLPIITITPVYLCSQLNVIKINKTEDLVC